MPDSVRDLLNIDSLHSLLSKLDEGTLDDKEIASFAVRQQANTVLAGRLALKEAIELQEETDANIERFLTTGDSQELRPLFKQRDIR